MLGGGADPRAPLHRQSSALELIPLCHPLAPRSSASRGDVDRGELELIVEARTIGPAGVEMEPLTAASVVALTVYDIAKGSSGAEVAGLALVEKSGRALGSLEGVCLPELVTRGA